MQLKALLIKDDLERSELLKQSLLEFGHDVVAEATMTDDLLKRVETTQPDLLVIDSDSPGKVLLSRLRELASQKPLPVALFTEEDNREVIHQAERKTVERAKGILMKQRGFDEPQAYHALRKMGMDKNLRIGQIAENVIAVAELLN